MFIYVEKITHTHIYIYIYIFIWIYVRQTHSYSDWAIHDVHVLHTQ